ncbi:hypothetical protein [Sulfitobacter sp. R18_1]|uniref:capsular polysaccharide export protein, LipB/KpsS family n=1 Tax=Sulfitobacter sp. R18_1 TaxID=2821104 RepID=UPI001ADC23F7|nr:hypothetical protein [Sulfitobacter sp. R18_1]MBO9428591.1 hypothetical protein [Sulfitobacter sp. R18_1]
MNTFISKSELSEKHNYALGITPWKRENFAYFTGKDNCTFIALREYERAVDLAERNKGRVICWSSSVPSGLMHYAQHVGVELFLVEDGFVRSSGLGIKLNMPASLCFSRAGIHYDATKPCELETYLNTHEFTLEEERAGNDLIEFMMARRISKYNIKGSKPSWPTDRDGKRILVVGQVEDDASIKFGSPMINTNADLMIRSRRDNPEASIVYRPHPDVSAGLRLGKLKDPEAIASADLISKSGDIFDLIEMADEVHVMSSQTGLEALMMGKKVVCYGQPFYSGWGLTVDVFPQERRTAFVTIGELISAAFVDYPVYIDPWNGTESDAFNTVKLIANSKTWPRAPRSYITAVWFKRKLLAAKRLKKKINDQA